MEKKCIGCNKVKSLDNFYIKKSAKDGRASYCKKCEKLLNQSDKRKAQQREYRQSDKGKAVQKRYRQSEKGKATNKKHHSYSARKLYYQEYEKSEVRQRTKKRYAISDKRKIAQKRYKQSQKGKQADKKGAAIRRARKTEAGGSYTVSEWYNICKFYDFHCLRCADKFLFEELTPDHIKPISKGGTSHIWNIQPLCENCNKRKGSKEVDYRKTVPNWVNRDGIIWQQNRLF